MLLLILLVSILTPIFCNAEPLPEPEVAKIIGGHKSARVKFQIVLYKNDELWCSGTILHPKIILTAGHCFFNYTENNFTIRAGTLEPYTGGQGPIKVIDHRIHPNYTTVNFDVAVLKLEKPIDMTDPNVALVRLVKVGRRVRAGSVGVISGWGRLWEDGPFPDYLMTTTVKVFARKYCEDHLPKVPGFTTNMMCAGNLTASQDACQYDSGGPLIIKGKQAGIVSWGIGCGEPGHPGVYTDLSVRHLRDFIEDTKNEFLNN